jgi:hypothetical protein
MPHPPFHMEKEGGPKVGFKEYNLKRYCNTKIDNFLKIK